MAYWFKSRLGVFALALLLRLAISCQVIGTIPLAHYWSADEPSNIAVHLLAGRGFASPYDAQQATAWLAPVYPLVVASVFGVLGSYSPAATYTLLTLNALFAAATALVIFELGQRTFGATTGALAGWLWAMWLPNAVMPVLIWDTCLSGLVFAIGFLLTMKVGESQRLARWAGAGAFWGFACLVNPALVGPVPFWWGLAWLRARKSGINLWKQVLAGCVALVAVITPWLVRNYAVFHTPVFIRSNFAAELYYGNLGFVAHPFLETHEYQRLGEVPYVRSKQAMVMKWIREHPVEFSARSLRRAVWFWNTPKITQPYCLAIALLAFLGVFLAIREGNAGGLPFLVVLLFYPVPYYVSYIFPKYRYPIEPVMMVLCAYTLVCGWRFVSARWRQAKPAYRDVP